VDTWPLIHVLSRDWGRIKVRFVRLALKVAIQNHTVKVKVVHPRIGHEVPEGEQMYTYTLPSTSALDGGGWSSRPGRFTPRKDPVPIE
jgi:hypothetical protein